MRHVLTPRRARGAFLGALALVFALAAPVDAQDALEGARGSAANDAEREMVELFGKVERRLREIDELLVDAGAGDTSRLSEPGPAGIDRLLRDSIESGRETLRDIDRIIELAQQFGQQQGGGGGQQSGEPQEGGDSEGGSPLDRGGQSTQREATPEAPGGQEPGSEGPRPGGEEEGGEEGEGETGQQPGEDGQPDQPGGAEQADPRNREGDRPPGGDTETTPIGPDGADRWGELPIKVRDVFRHEGSEELPPQYRDWIDAYYRRLQREGRR